VHDPTDVREDVSVEDHAEEFGAGSDAPGGLTVEGIEIPDEAVGGTPTAADGDTDAPSADPELTKLRTDLDERTGDLQRVSAEYANYRRRVDRDRESTVAAAKAQVASELLTVLDDVERAKAHGDLTGPFKVVADRLTESLNRIGLTSFAEVGDAFDPSVHEAVASASSADVDGPTVTTVMRRGYRFGEKVLRPAMVEVTDHDPDAAAADPTDGGPGTAGQ
jgi:molecular chaperone GrpE